jgi:hypothetical protein
VLGRVVMPPAIPSLGYRATLRLWRGGVRRASDVDLDNVIVLRSIPHPQTLAVVRWRMHLEEAARRETTRPLPSEVERRLVSRYRRALERLERQRAQVARRSREFQGAVELWSGGEEEACSAAAERRHARLEARLAACDARLASAGRETWDIETTLEAARQKRAEYDRVALTTYVLSVAGLPAR